MDRSTSVCAKANRGVTLSQDNYYMRRYNCTRNQYRRIILGTRYQEAFDGPLEEYEIRKNMILKKRGE